MHDGGGGRRGSAWRWAAGALVVAAVVGGLVWAVAGGGWGERDAAREAETEAGDRGDDAEPDDRDDDAATTEERHGDAPPARPAPPRLVAEARTAEGQAPPESEVAEVAAALAQRLDGAGVAVDPRVEGRWIVLGLDDADDVERAASLAAAPWAAQVRPVLAAGSPEDLAGPSCAELDERRHEGALDAAADATVVRCLAEDSPDGVDGPRPAFELGPAAVDDAGFDGAEVEAGHDGASRGVRLVTSEEGGHALRELTGELACEVDPDRRRLAIVVDHEVLTAPTLAPDVACGEGIARDPHVFVDDEGQAERLAAAVRAAALSAGWGLTWGAEEG